VAARNGQALAEWKAGWPLVLSCAFGFSLSTLPSQSIGMFMEPIATGMGWSRAEISISISISVISIILLSPIGGAAVDRWGSRRLAIPGIICAASVLASLGLVQTIQQWFAMWLLYAIVSIGVMMAVWTAAISKAFTASRGLAVAVTISGTAMTGIVAPPLANWLIEDFGWRLAMMWLAAGWGSVALILSIFFLREPRPAGFSAQTAASANADERSSVDGLTIREAIRSGPLWRIGVSTFFILLFGGSLVVHQVPILVDAGVTRGHAALLASAAAAAGLGGKLVTGWLMDRAPAARISGVTLGAAAIGFTLLLEPFRTPITVVTAMIIIGYAGGAKLQVTAYLTGRYGGLRNYGKIFGVMTSIIAIGGGVGPTLAGAVYDSYGSYTPFLIAGIPGSLFSGWLIFGLGPYPRWKTVETSESTTTE
jgi:MFS family permease